MTLTNIFFELIESKNPITTKKTPFAHEQTSYSYTNTRFEWSIPT